MKSDYANEFKILRIVAAPIRRLIAPISRQQAMFYLLQRFHAEVAGLLGQLYMILLGILLLRDCRGVLRFLQDAISIDYIPLNRLSDEI